MVASKTRHVLEPLLLPSSSFTRTVDMDHSLFDAQPYLTRKETTWVIGLVLSGIAYGSLLTLGITCLAALYRSPPTFRYKLFFSSYVVAVLFINTFLQIWNAESTITAIFYTDPDRITFFYHGWENVFLVVLLILTDGILVSTYLLNNEYHPSVRLYRFGGVIWFKRFSLLGNPLASGTTFA